MAPLRGRTGDARSTSWLSVIRLGAFWFDLLGTPIYHPWRLFEWWYFFDAYAPDVFLKGGTIAASSGVVAALAAVGMSVWRSRQSRLGTTYGSARWAGPQEITQSGLTAPTGVFLGRIGFANTSVTTGLNM